ncbi:hypothetical protein NA57DRAFT_50041, partial [Rhizodiscina lignyota]
TKMLDENLPTFFLKQAPDNVKHHHSFYLTYRGSEPEPAYNLKHPDPASPPGKNCYAAALFDSYNPEILYGEVLIRPEWTQPSLSQEDIRKNGGVPPPPQPILPQEFTIQLYNPDQQVVVRQKSGGWGGTPSYNFSMPQQTFRLPSSSALDRQLSDPAADMTTPKINFTWKKDGKLSKDLGCFMTGKSTDQVGKKKHKEPDIIVSMFQALKEVTIYESNYHRIDIEDPKGLEVVLLLSAAVLKEVYFTPLREAFNVVESGQLGLRKHSSTNDVRRQSLPQLRTSSAPNMPTKSSRPAPPADPRSQWEIDNETARLKAAQDTERRAAEGKRREQERADAEAAKKLKKQMDAEEKERRRKQVEVDKETERLRKKYGTTGQDFVPPLPSRQNYAPRPQQQPPQPRPQQYSVQPPRPQQGWHAGPYLGPPTMAGASGPSASQSSFFHSNGLPAKPQGYIKPKKSFWGLGSSRDASASGSDRNVVRRKSSVMF